MTLNLEKLMKYDLIEDLESKMQEEKEAKMLFDFLGIYQQIHSIDQFIRDYPRLSIPARFDRQDSQKRVCFIDWGHSCN